MSELQVDDWVLVDISEGVAQQGQIVQVIPAEDGGVWEYDVRVRGGDVIAAQPIHVHPDPLGQQPSAAGQEV